MARDALEAFDRTWGRQYPSIAQAWRRAWEEVVPFFAFGPEIRRVIYTTNAVEGLNRVIRKAIKTRGSFPSEEAGVPPPDRGTPDCVYAARGTWSIWSRRNWAGERWPWRSISQCSL